ncbi:MAG: hypothetical protein WC421_05920 [Elusimicrobiales bacterium]
MSFVKKYPAGFALAVAAVIAVAAGAARAQDTTSYAEIIIKGETISKFPFNRPKLQLVFDPMDALTPMLEPDDKLFLADSPVTFDWKHNRPDTLHSPKVIKPQWHYLISRGDVVFDIAFSMARILVQPPAASWYAGLQWELDIMGDDGSVFHKFSGSGKPPDKLTWDGKNQAGLWVRAGHSYNAFLNLTDSGGAHLGGPASPAEFRFDVREIVLDGAPAIEVDSARLFGDARDLLSLDKDRAEPALSAAADIIKMRYNGRAVSVVCYADSKPRGDEQAGLARDLLARLLNRQPDAIAFSGTEALPTERQFLIKIK